jgi:polysaccharide biosynthesis transport protein
LKRYTSRIKPYSWVVLPCVLLAIAIGMVILLLLPRTYQVSTSLVVKTGEAGNTFSPKVAPLDGIPQAIDDSITILSHSFIDYVYQSDPLLKQRGYTSQVLYGDVTVSPSATITSFSQGSTTITVTATTPNPDDSVLVANDVVKTFQRYKQQQVQDALDQQRKLLEEQYAGYQKQSKALEAQILSITNPADLRLALWTTDRTEAIQNMDAIQSQLLQLPSTVSGHVEVIQLARVSDISPYTRMALVIAATAGLGLLIGIVTTLFLAAIENRLRSVKEVEEILGVAYLGSLPKDKQLEESPVQARGLTISQLADVSANLHLTDVLPGQWRAPKGVVLLVTSAQEADGKSTVAVILSGILARAGHSVVVVDGNLRKPTTHLALGMNPAGRGLSGLLKSAGGENIDGVVQRSNVSGVWLLAGGQAIDDAALLLEQKLPDILEQLRRKVDVVIVDGPALLSGAEASILADMVDGVALVVDARRDKVRQLLRVKEILCSLTQTPVGVIMNRLPKQRRNNYFVTAYSAKAPTEKRKPDYANASNGNGNGVSNGQNEVLSLLDVSPKPQMPVSPVSQMPMPPVPPNPMPPTPFGVPAAPVPTQRTAPGSSPGIVPSRADMTSSWPQRLGKDE